MKRSRKFLKFSLTIALALTSLSTARAETLTPAIVGEYMPSQIIVGFGNVGSARELEDIRSQARRDVAAKSFSQISPLASDTELIELGQGISVREAIVRLSGRAGIRFVEPNFKHKSMQVPNDPSFTNGSLWGLYGASTTPANQYGSNAAGAWSTSTGASNVFIGVIDEGIQIDHPDLQQNIGVNPGEVAGDGIDNDANGYIDDVNGWDFFYDDKTVNDGLEDDHGTHVAGTIGARGDNSQGVTGVNWNVKLMSGKFLGPNGGYTSDAIAAVDYFTNLKKKGLNIVATSNSWGGGGFSQALLDAINRGGNEGILFIAAAGNNATNNDLTARYPTGYQCTNGGTRGWDCVISVASITSTGALSSFSNFGATTVDIGAPGSAILSTVPTNSYASYSGTSMATPHVSGAAALCKAINPGISASQIRNAITSSAVATTSLTGKTATGGRLNIGAMATVCSSGTTPYSVSAASFSPVSASVSPGYIESSTASTLTLTRSGSTGSNPTASITVNSGSWNLTTLSSISTTQTTVTSGSGATLTLENSSGSLQLSLAAGSPAGTYAATVAVGTSILGTYSVTVASPFAISSASASPTSATVPTSFLASATQTTITLTRSGSTGSAPTTTLSVSGGTWSLAGANNVSLSASTISSGTVTITLLNSSGSFTLNLNPGSGVGIYTASLGVSSLSYSVDVGLVPNQVSDLSCVKNTSKKNSGRCSWSALTPTPTRYEYRTKQSTSTTWTNWTSTLTNTNFTLNGLKAGVTYNVEVRAVNKYGPGLPATTNLVN